MPLGKKLLKAARRIAPRRVLEAGFNYRICRRYGYIFIHIPKTAGNSIGALLSALPRSRADLLENYRIHKHSKPDAVRSLVGDTVWNGSFKFAFVRNPWDLMVSSYHWWLHSAEKFPQRRDQVAEIRALGSFRHFMLSDYGRTMINERRGEMFDWVGTDGRIVLDFVGRFERLEEDWRTVCSRLGVPYVPLPHINASHRQNYRDYYDPELRDLVATRFRSTIETFGYDY